MLRATLSRFQGSYRGRRDRTTSIQTIHLYLYASHHFIYVSRFIQVQEGQDHFHLDNSYIFICFASLYLGFKVHTGTGGIGPLPSRQFIYIYVLRATLSRFQWMQGQGDRTTFIQTIHIYLVASRHFIQFLRFIQGQGDRTTSIQTIHIYLYASRHFIQFLRVIQGQGDSTTSIHS